MLNVLDDKPFIFVTGKGGVGKSTMCASIGLSLAMGGKHVLIVEIDTYSAMAGLFGLTLPPSQRVSTAHPGLDVVNLHARDALIEAIKQFVPSDRVARGIIGNRIAQVFFSAAPSVNEFSLLSQITRYHTQKDTTYDHIVVDMPASGHAVTFLKVPETLRGMVRVGGLAKSSEALSAQISDPSQTALVAVCLPEEMPVNETIDMAHALRHGLGRPMTLAILNMVHPPPFDPALHPHFQTLLAHTTLPPLEDIGGASASERVFQANELAWQWHTRDAHYAGVLRRRFDQDVALIQTPVVYGDQAGGLVAQLAAYFNGHPVATVQPPPSSGAHAS